jgi:hypothetical protein
MVKTVRVFLALFATLWYTTSPINSNAPSHIWEYDIDRILNQKPVSMVAPDYYKPLEFDKVKYTAADVLCLAKNPKWSKKKKVMASIDRHIFYGSKNSL